MRLIVTPGTPSCGGTRILTGTPEGVGPLTDGDEVSVTVELAGTLTNRVVIRD